MYMPMPMSSMNAEAPHPPTHRTPSSRSTNVVLVNGRPLKSCLKPASLLHVRAQSMPSTPYDPRNAHFKDYDDGLVSVRLFCRTGKPASVSKPSFDTESESESESDFEPSPGPSTPPSLPDIFFTPWSQAPRSLSPPLPSVTVEGLCPTTQRTPSSTSVILVNGRPLKPCLKLTSLPHARAQSMPSTPYGPKHARFNEDPVGSVRSFRPTEKLASVSNPSSDTETESESESDLAPSPGPSTPPPLPDYTFPPPSQTQFEPSPGPSTPPPLSDYTFFPRSEIHETIVQAPRSMSLLLPSVTIDEPQPTFTYPLSTLQPQMHESAAQTPRPHTRSRAADSNAFLFVPPTSLFFLYSNTSQSIPPPRSTPGLFRARWRAEDDHRSDFFVHLRSTHRYPGSWWCRKDCPRPRCSHPREGRVPFRRLALPHLVRVAHVAGRTAHRARQFALPPPAGDNNGRLPCGA